MSTHEVPAPRQGIAFRPVLLLLSGGRKDGVAGLQVCASTMIAPGCSVYVLRDDRVYQLTPACREGEAMIETFELTPRP